MATLLIVFSSVTQASTCSLLEKGLGERVPHFNSIPTAEYDQVIESLTSKTSFNLSEPLKFKYLNSRTGASEIPLSFRAYKDAKIIQSKQPSRQLASGERLIENFLFGYEVTSGEFREIGKVNYLILSSDGRVQEVGVPTNHLTYEFRNHIFGNSMSSGKVRRLKELSSKLIKLINQNPENRAKLEEFARSRNWPENLEVEGGLSYFNATSEWLLSWAKDNGYSATDLRDAGWITLNSRGITVRHPNSIRIPFFDDPGQSLVNITRIRKLAGSTGPKYLSFPKDRSLTREIFGVPGKLYNSWRLSEVAGKEVVLTEGEFKCLVATKLTGIVHLGIPGITQFDVDMVRAIIAAKPRKITVLMDRDPIGKSIMRVDKVSDAQRAAYQIAKELERSAIGIEVKVATLPDVFRGGKVGADDLLLQFGANPYLQALQDSVSPNVFAGRMNLNPVLQDLLVYRRKVSRAIDKYSMSVARGGPSVASDQLNIAKEIEIRINEQIQQILEKEYSGAKSITQPHPDLAYIPQVMRNPENIRIQTESGNNVSSAQFKNNIILLDYTLKDVDHTRCRMSACTKLPISSAEMTRRYQEFVQRGKSSLSDSMQATAEVFDKMGRNIRSIADFKLLTLMSDVLTKFPPDDYLYEFNVQLYDGSQSVSLPVVIFSKSSQNVVATARLQAEQNSDLALFERTRAILRR